LKCVLAWVLLMAAAGAGQGQDTCPPGEIYYTISAPPGWDVGGLGCCGVAASDPANPAKGIVALNHLHQGFYMLPAHTSPEDYIEVYMPQDFSTLGKQITDMRIIGYEENQDLAEAYASYTGFLAKGKSIRCEFAVNGVPTVGSFTVVTNNLAGYGTTVDFLAGIFAPADQFDTEAPMLMDIIGSVQLIPSYRNLCIPSPPCPSWQYDCDDMCCNWPCNEENKCY